MARRLAGLLAASPVISLPVIRLIQETILPKSRQVHVAEVLLGSILQPISSPNPSTNPDDIEYRFLDEGIRSILLDSAPATDTVKVLSKYISQQFGKSLEEFIALLRFWQQEQGLKEQIRPFAVVTAEVLKRWGRYRDFIQEVEQYYGSVPVESSTVASIPQLKNFIGSVPPLKTFEFEVKTISFDFPESELQAFEYKVVTIEVEKTGSFGRETKLVLKERQEQSRQFIEELGNGVQLEMVLIPEGTFLMGSPRTEEWHLKSEEPQHQVNIKSFFIGKYPVTKAQWIAVAALPQINRKLYSPSSRLKGEDRPVQRASWYSAVEFCDRLSRHTGREYRLPSEAEWEYAARAGTTTPFHFGETITTDLANYNGNYTYGNGSKGEYRRKTTTVGSFGVANGFGLYDIHGNVWEWCADSWHNNYEGAPDDGRVWIDAEKNLNSHRVLRGGSWFLNPGDCRSACRLDVDPGDANVNLFGFRVVCVSASTL
ncbi:MAG: formylglycine-generating enzyme family protein [Symploca sp. SIO2E9]|nr:formylglycine-generating enzyme family protein [Symploca sp. SIO2E9]